MQTQGEVFEKVDIDVLLDEKNATTHTIPIQVNVVTESNKHLVPPFETHNFEFFGLS